ncbi:capsular polysaccharide biosynthesis protein [Pantoea sp. X85]|jgi:capsular polysaccharide export protein|uniref:capsular polysaccharide biosynthesis protein n=1 Tax=Pantoea sp. X85 TaxID=3037258 RepID=UPI0024136B65|nr:capsular polysaccharide biosynthesis protein [Pantoea sp. X85]WFL69461.1 capsular polysaccharide biosynthesis protein [Pantoea sp. X85]
MIGIFSSGIWRIPFLRNFLAQPCQKLSRQRPVSDAVTTIAVWGYRPNTRQPVAWARGVGKSVLRLEDGYIRSLDLGVNGAPPFSLVLDRLGIYYDANRPSELEKMIQERAVNQRLADDAKRAMSIIVEQDLSKYNQAPAFIAGAHATSNVVLVIDQTLGDMSVTYGNAGPNNFVLMLEAAIRENPGAMVWIKVHPDVLQGKKSGYYHSFQSTHRIHLMADDVSPQSLLRHVSRVYVMTSQYGFEALMAGKPVTCFGQPWYAGWGLTDDRHPQAKQLSERRGNATLEQLFAAAYLRYSRYIHPLTGEPATLFDVLHWIQLQRNYQLPRIGHLWAPGLSMWKYTILKPFLRTATNTLSFSKSNKLATACVVWGIAGEQRWLEKAQAQQLPVWRMEDGFLRSSGLGSDLLPPLSLVLDKRGIYYDATRPSDLEMLLNESELTDAQCSRARKIHHRLVNNRISKYNLGADFTLPADSKGKRVLLVPGQVENDASIQTGTFTICTNRDLLRTVRERNPAAYIIYKPHPDVVVGNRKGHITDREINQYADYQALDADIIQCIQVSNEVHTMTSLSGFEALLHGKRVYCYGMPFYAGWGLTYDEHDCFRRVKQLGLYDLIYQALIAYPTYIHPLRLDAISVEEAIEILINTPRANMVIDKNWRDRLMRMGKKLSMFIKVKLAF